MAEDSSSSLKVSTTLAPGMKALLDQCIARKLYGDQAATVRQFINAGLERLIEQNRLIDVPGLTVATANPDEKEDGK